MIKASYYVIKDVEDLLERRNLDRLKDVSKGYCARYINDTEFHDICSQLIEALNSNDEEKLKEIEQKLAQLREKRRL